MLSGEWHADAALPGSYCRDPFAYVAIFQKELADDTSEDVAYCNWAHAAILLAEGDQGCRTERCGNVGVQGASDSRSSEGEHAG